MKKRWIIGIGILVIILFFIVYSMFACSRFGSAIGIKNKECKCNGIELNPFWMGGGMQICFGFCNKCKCYINPVEYQEIPDYIPC